MRRLVLTTVILLGIALPASAKMPPFDMEVETGGDTVHVEVTISGDESLIDSFDTPDLNWLLAVLPADQVDEKGRPLFMFGDRTNLRLNRVEPGVYQGSVALEPGRWAVVPFPGMTGEVRGSVEGWYPNTVVVEVGAEESAIWALVAVGAAIAIAWRFGDVVHVRPV